MELRIGLLTYSGKPHTCFHLGTIDTVRQIIIMTMSFYKKTQLIEKTVQILFFTNEFQKGL